MSGGHAQHGHVAVIDIGSNSIRLVVYERLSRAPLPRFNEKSLCGLGRDLTTTGKIDDASCECAVNAVRRFCQIALAMECDRIDLLATEALRKASNGAETLARLTEAAGRPIRVLSGVEEAYYAARGVSAGFFEPRGLVGDLGGGSLDIAEVDGRAIGQNRLSVQVGTLIASEILGDPSQSAKKTVDGLIEQALAALMPPKNFYLVGGSWRALARIHMAEAGIPLDQPHNYTVEAEAMRRHAKRIWRMPVDELAGLPALSSRRLPNIQGAALVLDRVLKKTRAENVVVSSLGLREGWLFDLLPETVQQLDPLIEGAKAFGRHRARVREFADALVRWTDRLFPTEDPNERRLRLAACELTDIAWADHRSVQAEMAMRRLLQFPFVGIDYPGRAFLAACIHSRYAGELSDPALAPLSQLTSAGQLRRAQILGRAILVGHRMSGSVPALLDSAELIVDGEGVTVEVADGRDAADSDAVRNRLKMLAKAVGVTGTELRVKGQ